MALPYSYVNLQQARQEIANRLYDSDMVFWTSAELTLYIQESLQTFNALAQYWRGDFVFPVINNAVGYGEGGYGEGGYGGGATLSPTWYDLTQVTNTLRPYTVTDFSLYSIIEYHLLEPPTGPIWTGTDQFTLDDIRNSIQRRRDEILTTTGCTVTQSLISTNPNQIRNSLNDFVLDVRRIAWFPTLVAGQGWNDGGYGNGGYGGYTGTPNVMWPEDVWSFQAFNNGYTQYPQGIPNYYAVSVAPPLSFDVDTAPNTPGVYELLTVNAGTTLTPDQPTIIPIPTDFAWVLKWGALADLLSKEAEAKDQLRSDYCNHRYQQGMKLLGNAPAALQVKINNVPLWIDAVRSADEYMTDWQGLEPGSPGNVFVAGLNLIAMVPAPDDTGYSATATVVMNAPIPVNDGDFVQMSRGDYDAVIDYAQHLALFKCGGAEFEQTKEQYARLVRQAALYNDKLAESGDFQEELYGNSQQEEIMNPRLVKSTGGSDQGGS